KHPDTVGIVQAVAHGYDQILDRTAAVNALELLFEHDPDDVPGLLLRAHILSEFHRYEEALKACEKAVRRVPEAAEPRRRLAWTLHQLGRVREAVQQYEQLRQAEPDDAEALLGLARCRIDLSQPETARALLD